MAKTLTEKTQEHEVNQMVGAAKRTIDERTAEEKETQAFQERAVKHGVALAALGEGNTPAHHAIMAKLRDIRSELKRALKGGINEGDLQELLDHTAVNLESGWVKDSLREQVQRYKRLSEVKQEFMKEHPEPTIEQMMRIQAEIGSKTDEEISRMADRYIANAENGHYQDPYRLELIASRLRGSKITDADLTFKLLRGAMQDFNYQSQHLNTEEGRTLLTEVKQFEKSPGNFQVLMKNQSGGLTPFPVRFNELMSDLLESVKKEVASEPVSQRYK